MKVGIQTLTNKKYTIEIDEKETVQTLKQKIHEEHALGEPDEQKLIYLGKILKNDQTIESAAIKPNGMIVLMVSKIKKPAASADAASSSAAPAATPSATPAAAAPATPAPAATPASTPAPATPAAAPTPASPAAAAPAAAGGAVPAGGVASANNALGMGSALEPIIADLMQLGFPRDQVQAALRAAYNNPDRAADYLFNGIPENVLRDMGPRAVGVGGAGQPPVGGAAGGAAPAPAPASPAQAGGAHGAAPAQNALAQLLAQGGAQPAGGAAGAVAGAGAAGAAGGAADGDEMGDVDPSNPLAGLAANPQFQQMRAMLQQNPQMIPVILQQIAQAEPAIAQMIAQNPEAFAQLLAGGDGAGMGGGRGGAGGAGGARQHTIQITLEEKQQLDNLEALGFSRQRALEAWLLCDRNEALAASFLFDNNEDDAPPAGGAGGAGAGAAGGAGGQ